MTLAPLLDVGPPVAPGPGAPGSPPAGGVGGTSGAAGGVGGASGGVGGAGPAEVGGSRAGAGAGPAVRVALTAHAVPDPDPPYDDGGPPVTLDTATPLPPYVPPREPGRTLRLVPEPDDDEDTFGTVRTPRAALEDPVPRAAMLARVVLEVLSGVRPLGQLTRWVSPDVLAALQAMVACRSARPVPAALRRVLVSEPLPGVAEVTAIVQRGPRAEALALRLDGLDGRWVVTAVQRP